MQLHKNEEIIDLTARVRGTMSEYMKEGDVAYSQKDVDKCIELIHSFLGEMQAAQNKEEGMTIVEKTVLALNDLNERCDDELIETDQREDLAEIIILAGHLKGYNDRDDDITEDWREW